MVATFPEGQPIPKALLSLGVVIQMESPEGRYKVCQLRQEKQSTAEAARELARFLEERSALGHRMIPSTSWGR